MALPRMKLQGRSRNFKEHCEVCDGKDAVERTEKKRRCAASSFEEAFRLSRMSFH
jgi:hypothetical protein